MQDFSFEAKSLNGYRIEEAICMKCGLINADSSNLPPMIKPDNIIPVLITAQNGSVTCKVAAYKSNNSENDCYTVYVSNIEINSR